MPIKAVIGNSVAVYKEKTCFKEEGLIKNHDIVSLDTNQRITQDDIIILPIAHFLKMLWQGDIIKPTPLSF